MIDLNDSWPAVSQICSLMFFSWIWIVRAPNSTPIVRSCYWRNRLSVNWSSRHDFPTPITQRKMKLLNTIFEKSGGKFARQVRYLSRKLINQANLISKGGGCTIGHFEYLLDQLTSISNDDVFEEVCVRHVVFCALSEVFFCAVCKCKYMFLIGSPLSQTIVL